MAAIKLNFDLERCIRPNIKALKPYTCARDEFPDDGETVLLDANENAFGPILVPDFIDGSTKLQISEQVEGLHRYPDPNQTLLKQLFCDYRNKTLQISKTPLTPANLYAGVGSDEAIDVLMRCFCIPGVDKILTCPPTYGMYRATAEINDVSIVHVPLDAETFELQPDAIIAALDIDPNIKLIYLCSPGNPGANLLAKDAVCQVLSNSKWNGVVIIDEAYVDFASSNGSCAPLVHDFPNVVVMQTLSKSFGLAGIRIGFAICPPAIAQVLNNVKAPYNISTPTSALACTALQPANMDIFYAKLKRMQEQKERLIIQLPKIKGVGRIRGGLDANFLLVEMIDTQTRKPSNDVAMRVYRGLAQQKAVVVRFRGKEYGCEGCLRLTVGTAEENSRLLTGMNEILAHHAPGVETLDAKGQRQANDVIA